MTPKTRIHPVVVPVPEAEQQLQGRDKVSALRRIAREALSHSARYSGHTPGALEKDEHGAPLPSNGVFWSLTHKSSYTAAVTAPHPIGIDIENIRPVSKGMYARLAETREWNLSREPSVDLFFRYWTAKEAVLKAVGKGLTGLSRCHISKIVDDSRLELTYDGAIWRVIQQRIADHHIVALTDSDADIEWHHLKKP